MPQANSNGILARQGLYWRQYFPVDMGLLAGHKTPQTRRYVPHIQIVLCEARYKLEWGNFHPVACKLRGEKSAANLQMEWNRLLKQLQESGLQQKKVVHSRPFSERGRYIHIPCQISRHIIILRNTRTTDNKRHSNILFVQEIFSRN